MKRLRAAVVRPFGVCGGRAVGKITLRSKDLNGVAKGRREAKREGGNCSWMEGGSEVRRRR